MCFFFIHLRDVFPHSLHTNVCHKCHSAKVVLESQRDDTVLNPEVRGQNIN